MIQYNIDEISVFPQLQQFMQSALKRINSLKSEFLGQVLGNSRSARLYGKFEANRHLRTKVVDRFEQAGINQTRHKIYLVVEAEMRIVIPLVSSAVKVESQVPLTEATIMGEVPHLYLNAGVDSLLPSLNGNDK